MRLLGLWAVVLGVVAGWTIDDYGSGGELMDDELDPDPPAHYRLEAYLMRHYNRRLIPRRFASKPVNVKFRIGLYQIVEVNEPYQFILLNSWIVESWSDDFLYWNPQHFGNLTEIILPQESLWQPDTTLYNSLVMEDGESRRLQSIKVTTDTRRRTALVEFLYPTLYKFSCTLNLKLFPFDLQHCTMTFGSWTHDNKAIDYFPDNTSTSPIATDMCIENEGWNIIQTDVFRHERKYSCCPNNYTLLEFTIHIQRKPLYYLVNLIIPTSIITLIAIVGFFTSVTVNDMREEKISLGITTVCSFCGEFYFQLLSMSILIFMVSDKMPSTSEFIPLIGWFYTCMMGLIAMGTLCSTWVIYIQKKGIIGHRPSTQTMRWARRVSRLIMLEMPLLMKQAYALKAKSRWRFIKQILKSRWRFVSMFKAKRSVPSASAAPADGADGLLEKPAMRAAALVFQEKLAKQHQRKQSMWQKPWKKFSRPSVTTNSTLTTLVPPSNLGLSHFNAAMVDKTVSAAFPRRVGSSPRGSFRRPDSYAGTELMNISIDEELPDRQSEDEDEWTSNTPVPGSPTVPNGAPQWPPQLTVDRPRNRRSPSNLSAPAATSISVRRPRPDSIVPDVLVDGNPMMGSPNAQPRNLAEIEYDWLAAVVERIFLCIFLILFFFMSVGINMLGFFYFYFTTVDKVDE